MHFVDVVKSMHDAYRKDPRDFILSRIFGLGFILFVMPAVGLFIELSINDPLTAAWFKDHPALRVLGYVGLVATMLAMVGIVKLDPKGRAMRAWMALFMVAVGATSTVSMLLLLGR